jgi:hypothetical protein
MLSCTVWTTAGYMLELVDMQCLVDMHGFGRHAGLGRHAGFGRHVGAVQHTCLHREALQAMHSQVKSKMSLTGRVLKAARLGQGMVDALAVQDAPRSG